MMERFNIWDPKEYSKWYHYLWLMPILTFGLIYVLIVNKSYKTWLKLRGKW